MGTRAPWITWTRLEALSLAGVAGPLLFFSVVIIEGWLRPDYRPLRSYISGLCAGPRGWIQATNFLVFGVLLVIFSEAVRNGILDGGATRAGSTFVTLIGVGTIGCGVFRPESWPPSSMGAGGLLHLFFGVVSVFALMPAACLTLAHAFAADPRWARLVPYTFATGAATVILFIAACATFALKSPRGMRPRIGNMYGGLIQRADLGIFLAWEVIVVLKLWRGVA